MRFADQGVTATKERVYFTLERTERLGWKGLISCENWRFGIGNLQSGQGIRPFGILASEWRKILNSKLNALSALTV